MSVEQLKEDLAASKSIVKTLKETNADAADLNDAIARMNRIRHRLIYANNKLSKRTKTLARYYQTTKKSDTEVAGKYTLICQRRLAKLEALHQKRMKNLTDPKLIVHYSNLHETRRYNTIQACRQMALKFCEKRQAKEQELLLAQNKET